MRKTANIHGTDGGLITERLPAGRTLAQLIDSYQTDPVSGYHKLRFQSRQNADGLLRRLRAQYGDKLLSDIRTRDLKLWYMGWAEGGKLATGHAFIAQLRTLSSYGLVDLEDQECERISLVLSKLKIKALPKRKTFLTAEHAIAIRAKAHWRGWNYLALAQAIQFELILRQRDVIGHWVPIDHPGEPIESDIHVNGFKWIRGIRWEEVDENLILRHLTSKKQKEIEIDLKLAPMVLAELAETFEVPVAEITRAHLPPKGPIILCEVTGYPYTTAEYRRKWRLIADMAGIPKNVWNMDSRSGGISEADSAGVPPEHIQEAATHSDAQTTRGYIRGSQADKIANVQQKRVEYRNRLLGELQ